MLRTGRRALLGGLAALPFVMPGALAASGRVAAAPIGVRDRRVWMPVRFGAGEPHGFILDTGAFANMIDRDLARRLKLNEAGSLLIQGLGGVGRYVAYRAPDVALGEVRVGSLLFAAYRDDVRLHPRAGGLLSAGLVTVADSDLDFDEGVWRLHIDGREDRTGFEALPSTIRSAGPQTGAAQILVDVEIDGKRFRLHVDTGAPGDILLSPAGTRRSGLWNETMPFAPTRHAGLGGDAGRARLVRAGAVRVGGIAFERPLLSLSSPGERRMMDSDGLLGIGLLQRMNLSTDVRGRKLWARRNGQPARPERYGLSGLWLGESGGGPVVEEVGTGSPAAAAGLRRGDRITSGTLQQWIARLGGRPGDTVDVPYRRVEETLTARLTLREFL